MPQVESFVVSAPGWSVAAAAWLLTYLLHSTVLLGTAWIATRAGPLSAPRYQAPLWKLATLAGLVTASTHLATFPTRDVSGRAQAAATLRGLPAEVVGGGVAGRLAEVDPAPRRVLVTAEVEERRASPRPLVGSASWLATGSVPTTQVRRAVDLRGSVPRGCEPGRLERIRDGAGGVRGQPGALAGLDVAALAEPCGPARHVAKGSRVLLGLWLSGALLALLALARGHGRLRRALGPSSPPDPRAARLMAALRAEGGARRGVRLLEASALGTPVAMTGGRIVLPPYACEELDDDELTAVLAHELGHVVRRDPAVLAALRLVEALLWVQPLNKVARHGFQEASEFLADAWAVRRTGRPLALARSLEKVARRSPAPPPAPVLAMARARGALVRRVHALVAPPSSGSHRAGVAWAALVLLPGVLLPPVRLPSGPTVRVTVVREARGPGPGAVDGGDVDRRVETSVVSPESRDDAR